MLPPSPILAKKALELKVTWGLFVTLASLEHESLTILCKRDAAGAIKLGGAKHTKGFGRLELLCQLVHAGFRHVPIGIG